MTEGAEVERLQRLRGWVAAAAAVAIVVALIAGTWGRSEPLPAQYRDAGPQFNLLGTPVVRGGAPLPAGE
jgi:hypothetical protein